MMAQITPEIAVAIFVAETVEQFGASEFRFVRLAQSYRTLSVERGWPDISDKRISAILLSLGCERERARGRQRTTMYRLPASLSAWHDEPLAEAA